MGLPPSTIVAPSMASCAACACTQGDKALAARKAGSAMPSPTKLLAVHHFPNSSPGTRSSLMPDISIWAAQIMYMYQIRVTSTPIRNFCHDRDVRKKCILSSDKPPAPRAFLLHTERQKGIHAWVPIAPEPPAAFLALEIGRIARITFLTPNSPSPAPPAPFWGVGAPGRDTA